jgi:hypothetical protein
MNAPTRCVRLTRTYSAGLAGHSEGFGEEEAR